MLPFAAVSLVVYGLGVPVVMGITLVKNRARIQRDQRLWLRGKGDSLADNMDFRVRRRYARMYQEFAAEFYWWRIVLMIRKVCFLSVSTFATNPMFQTSLVSVARAACGGRVHHTWPRTRAQALAILAVSFGLQQRITPFVSALEQHTVALKAYGIKDTAGSAEAIAEAVVRRGRRRSSVVQFAVVAATAASAVSQIWIVATFYMRNVLLRRGSLM